MMLLESTTALLAHSKNIIGSEIFDMIKVLFTYYQTGSIDNYDLLDALTELLAGYPILLDNCYSKLKMDGILLLNDTTAVCQHSEHLIPFIPKNHSQDINYSNGIINAPSNVSNFNHAVENSINIPFTETDISKNYINSTVNTPESQQQTSSCHVSYIFSSLLKHRSAHLFNNSKLSTMPINTQELSTRISNGHYNQDTNVFKSDIEELFSNLKSVYQSNTPDFKSIEKLTGHFLYLWNYFFPLSVGSRRKSNPQKTLDCVKSSKNTLSKTNRPKKPNSSNEIFEKSPSTPACLEKNSKNEHISVNTPSSIYLEKSNASKNIEYILKSLQRHKESSWYFEKQNSDCKINLMVLSQNLKDGLYDDIILFRSDVENMLNSCRESNLPGSIEYKVEEKARTHFEYLWAYYFPPSERRRKSSIASITPNSSINKPQIPKVQQLHDDTSSQSSSISSFATTHKQNQSLLKTPKLNFDNLLNFLESTSNISSSENFSNMKYILGSLKRHTESNWLLFPDHITSSPNLFIVAHNLQALKYEHCYKDFKDDVYQAIQSNIDQNHKDSPESKSALKARHHFDYLYHYYFPETFQRSRKKRILNEYLEDF